MKKRNIDRPALARRQEREDMRNLGITVAQAFVIAVIGLLFLIGGYWSVLAIMRLAGGTP